MSPSVWMAMGSAQLAWMARLEAHSWPGNIRELENCIKRATIMADGNFISADDIGLAPADASTLEESLDLRAITAANITAFTSTQLSQLGTDQLAQLTSDQVQALSDQQLPGLRDGQATAARLRVLVSRTLAQINHRRLEQGFATPWGDAPEYFSYRIGLLKAELERVKGQLAEHDPSSAGMDKPLNTGGSSTPGSGASGGGAGKSLLSDNMDTLAKERAPRR